MYPHHTDRSARCRFLCIACLHALEQYTPSARAATKTLPQRGQRRCRLRRPATCRLRSSTARLHDGEGGTYLWVANSARRPLPVHHEFYAGFVDLQFSELAASIEGSWPRSKRAAG